MRLISCHIENFGKLSNFDYNFNETKNIILEDNGWGKTTLAAFIRVMFYGFANPLKKDDYENERKRFKPWKGGVYGGSLSFSVNNKEYIINRVFFDREKEDTFSIRDAHTLLETTDFSKNIGEEIFKINHESFKNTIFVGQDELETKSTRDIESLLGNVSLEELDINNYDDALGTINGLINSLSPDRKTGRLYKLSRQLDNLEFENLSFDANKTRVSKLVERAKSLEHFLNKERRAKSELQGLIFEELSNKGEEKKEVKEEKKEEAPKDERAEKLKKDIFNFNKLAINEKTDVIGLFILFFGFFLTVLGVFLQNNNRYHVYAYPLTFIGIIIVIFYVSRTFFKRADDTEDDDEEEDPHLKEEKKEETKGYEPFKSAEDAEFNSSSSKYQALIEKMKLNDKKIDEHTGELYRLNREIEELTKEILKQEENITRLTEIKEEIIELKEKYEYTLKARDYLSLAKENFAKRYNKPVKKSFDKFLGYMLDETDDYILNINNELRIKDAGELRDVRMLSKAFRDVIGLALRLAFIESAFTKEKPFIILDDPFVNVDDNTLAPCLNTLNIISKDYQIIYFTCSISRT
ncbi:ATP-binding protein [Lachnospira multipara]|uniref:ATP-binding protein n=1 Tax=Lachnospira multipara TaxID=28051 RepID=UPI0004293018|nr:AAA family ATPase [Lachnospira multipara]